MWGAPGFDNDSGFGLIQADAALGPIRNQHMADFDGDGSNDIAFYRDGIWFVLRSTDGGFDHDGMGRIGSGYSLAGRL